ncbi:MAG: general stress protein CsbD [Nitrospira sp.]|nr:general stress protein CsbD [Nitrospira sp.]
MNQEQFKRSWTQLKGRLHKQWGSFTDEDLLQIAGHQAAFQTVLQKPYGEKRADVSQWADRWYVKWTGWCEGYQEVKSPKIVGAKEE